ncbi:MAG: hypothetical protein GC205_09935 [Bacteroidetes bacterium]|nr:hypothetical protein [Bacteroidota bacterium]
MPFAVTDRMQQLLFFGLLTVASLFGTNPYSFGVDNHFVTLPFLWEKAYPKYFPGDLVLSEVGFFYTWFLDGIAAVLRATGWPLSHLFFALHLVFTALTFAAFFHLARVLTECRAMAAVACLFLLFGTKTIGYVGTLESHLMERTVVLPLEFLALAWMLQRRWVAAFAATGLAFCIHPLSAFYTGFMIGIAGCFSLWQARNEPGWSKQAFWFGAALLAGAACAAPGLWLKVSGPDPVMPAGVPLPGWLDILALRSSYHVFPFTWPLDGWLRALLFWVGIALVQRGRKPSPKDQLVQATWFAVGIMAVLGTVFSEFIPLSLPIQFQFFRSYPFAFMLGMIVFARGMVDAARGDLSWKIALLAAVLAAPAWLEMDPLKYAAMLGTWAVLLATALYGVRVLHWPLPRMVIAPMAVVMLMVPVSLFLRGFHIDNQQEAQWVAVQQWARDKTPLDAGFIVPPGQRGFRVDSHRTVYVDWNDGTQNFFNQAFGPAWLERMKNVGFSGDPATMDQGYRALTEANFQGIATELPASSQVYAVLFRPTDQPFPVVFQNDKYLVVRVR